MCEGGTRTDMREREREMREGPPGSPCPLSPFFLSLSPSLLLTSPRRPLQQGGRDAAPSRGRRHREVRHIRHRRRRGGEGRRQRRAGPDTQQGRRAQEGRRRTRTGRSRDRPVRTASSALLHCFHHQDDRAAGAGRGRGGPGRPPGRPPGGEGVPCLVCLHQCLCLRGRGRPGAHPTRARLGGPGQERGRQGGGQGAVGSAGRAGGGEKRRLEGLPRMERGVRGG